MSKFIEIYDQTCRTAIRDGVFDTFEEYTAKLSTEALREGADPKKVENMKKAAKEIWNIDRITQVEAYRTIAILYQDLGKNC